MRLTIRKLNSISFVASLTSPKCLFSFPRMVERLKPVRKAEVSPGLRLRFNYFGEFDEYFDNAVLEKGFVLSTFNQHRQKMDWC